MPSVQRAKANRWVLSRIDFFKPDKISGHITATLRWASSLLMLQRRFPDNRENAKMQQQKNARINAKQPHIVWTNKRNIHGWKDGTLTDREDRGYPAIAVGNVASQSSGGWNCAKKLASSPSSRVLLYWHRQDAAPGEWQYSVFSLCLSRQKMEFEDFDSASFYIEKTGSMVKGKSQN